MFDSTDIAREDFLAVQVRPGEKRRNVVIQLLRNNMAVVADLDRSHASKTPYFWRYATER